LISAVCNSRLPTDYQIQRQFASGAVLSTGGKHGSHSLQAGFTPWVEDGELSRWIYISMSPAFSVSLMRPSQGILRIYFDNRESQLVCHEMT